MKTLIFILVLLLAGCGQSTAPKPRKEIPVAGEFRKMSYPVGDHEHIVVFDIPDRGIPTRCFVYVNEKTNTSNMRCDDATGSQPVAGPDLDR